MRTSLTYSLILIAATAAPLAAQVPDSATLSAERAAYATWLTTADNSPFAAIAQQPIGPGIQIGAGGELPLEGVGAYRVSQQEDIVMLDGSASSRALPRHRPVKLGRYTLVAGGTRGRAVLTVFDSNKPRGAPEYYPLQAGPIFTGPLIAAEAPGTERLLAPDGIEVEATEAGSVVIPINGAPVRLRVMRIPDPATGESELEIFFRDSTNASGTYPAGRFVALTPAADGHYRLDLNRARNPFCAYSSAYACPVPWQGNVLPARIEAGEKYTPK